MPEGEKHWGCQPVIGGDNLLPYPVAIGLTDLPNIWGASGPPGSGITGFVPHRDVNESELVRKSSVV